MKIKTFLFGQYFIDNDFDKLSDEICFLRLRPFCSIITPNKYKYRFFSRSLFFGLAFRAME